MILDYRWLDCIYTNLNMAGFVYWTQEKEYKEAVEALNEKNKEKAQLLSRLMEVNIHFCLQTK